LARQSSKNNSNNNKKRTDSQLRTQGSPRFRESPGGNRIVNAALLVSIVCVLVLGVSGAVYLDEFRGQRSAAAQAAAQPAAPPVQSASNAAPAAPAQLPPAPPASGNPPANSGQTTASASIPPLNQINPAAGPQLPKAAQPGYWVEYAAYSNTDTGADYAARLVKRLQPMGYKAYAVTISRADGKQYLIVRSETGGNRDSLENVSLQVSNALDIFPVVHGNGEAPVSQAAYTAPLPASAGSGLSYWVQFGAYDIDSYANSYAKKLSDSGIPAAVITRQRANGHVLYLVRSPPLPTPDEAQNLARQGQQLLGADTLVGQTIPNGPIPNGSIPDGSMPDSPANRHS
jgi:cell division septation protein DedD